MSGNPDAGVTVLEFADYQCPSCRDFFVQTKPFLDLTYIQAGDIRFSFYDFPLVDAHPNAFAHTDHRAIPHANSDPDADTHEHHRAFTNPYAHPHGNCHG